MKPPSNLRPELKLKIQNWIISFYHLDPRYKILKFFNKVAAVGADNYAEGCSSDEEEDLPNEVTDTDGQIRDSQKHHASLLRKIFNKSSILTVWRPTSKDAMRKMMEGSGVGKGLDIKGKSAKKGLLSALVPFLQIHDNEHKHHIAPIPVDAKMRIYYSTNEARQTVIDALQPFINESIPEDDADDSPEQNTTSSKQDEAEDDRILDIIMDVAFGVQKSLMQNVQQLTLPSSHSNHHHGHHHHKNPSETVRHAAFKLLTKSKLRHSQRELEGTGSHHSLTSIVSGASTDDSGGVKMNGSIRRGGLRHSDRSNSHESLSSHDSFDSVAEDEVFAVQRILGDMTVLDDYAPAKYGLEVTQRLFWEGCVQHCDITRRDDTKTGRNSVPGFQDANQKTLRVACQANPPPDPFPVVLQLDDENPLDPRQLVMAYEENGLVQPVVSDFDGFLLGWRREAIWFGCNLPREQEELMLWCVDKIEHILDQQDQPEKKDQNWTLQWLDVLKHASTHEGLHVTIPEYGFGDPKSYSIMEKAALKLIDTGAVRHGSECFNYYFPQEIDDYFLLVSDTLEPVPWKYVNVHELQSILLEKIKEGFVFPLNPKWVLCDPGWRRVYDELMASDALYADLSKDVWYPPFCGIREKIDRISKKHPRGFQPHNHPDPNHDATIQQQITKHNNGSKSGKGSRRARMSFTAKSAHDLAMLELDNFETAVQKKKALAKMIEESALSGSSESESEDTEEEEAIEVNEDGKVSERGSHHKNDFDNPEIRKQAFLRRREAALELRSTQSKMSKESSSLSDLPEDAPPLTVRLPRIQKLRSRSKNLFKRVSGGSHS